jgi:hypothetical protein
MSESVITIGEHIRVIDSRVLQEWIEATWSFTAGRGRWIAAHEKKAVRVLLESAKGTATTTPVPPAIAEVERAIKS